MSYVVYRECLRNHAARRGQYATDGCGEFMFHRSHPSSMKCDACGCHRNFHRKVFLIPPTTPGGPLLNVEQNPKERKTFTIEQEMKMISFLYKLGWRVRGKELEINQLCSRMRVSNQPFVTWTHNKSDEKDNESCCSTSTQNADSFAN